MLDLSDYSHNKNNLKNSGATEGILTPFAESIGSLSLDRASNQSVYIPEGFDFDLRPTQKFTLEAWVRMRNRITSGQNFSIMGKDTYNIPSTRNYYFYIGYGAVAPNTEVACLVTDASGNTDFYKIIIDLQKDNWYHLAVTCDVTQDANHTFEFFLGGNSQGHGIPTPGNNISLIRTSPTPFRIGARHNGTDTVDHFDGWIDEVRFWSDIRTQTEISDNKDHRLLKRSQGLVGYWPFEFIPSASPFPGHIAV